MPQPLSQLVVMLCSMQLLRNPGFFHPVRRQRPLPNSLHLAWRQSMEDCEGGLVSGAWPQRTQSHNPIWLQGKLGNVVWLRSQAVKKQGEGLCLCWRVVALTALKWGRGGGALFSSVPELIHGLTRGFSVIPSLLEYSQSAIPRLQLLLVRETPSNGTWLSLKKGRGDYFLTISWLGTRL